VELVEGVPQSGVVDTVRGVGHGRFYFDHTATAGAD